MREHPNAPFVLVTKVGSYSADSLLGLLRLVLEHRFWHWRQGDGWVD